VDPLYGFAGDGEENFRHMKLGPNLTVVRRIDRRCGKRAGRFLGEKLEEHKEKKETG